MERTMWLLVEVSDGMFPGEKAVSFQGAGGLVSMFLPADKVRHEQQTGRGAIKVEVLEMDDNYGLVGLPVQAAEGASVAKVKRAELSR